MLIHLTLPVRDLAVAVQFYDAALTVLDAIRSVASAHAVGYAARDSKVPFIWLVPNSARSGAVNTRIALRAIDAQQVARFHVAAIAAGGVSIAAPAPVPQHGPDAFGCTIHDLDGHQIDLIALGTSSPEAPKKSQSSLNEWPDGEAPDYPDTDWSA